MENLTHILIFKTDIRTEEDKLRVRKLFAGNEDIEDWNVDCDDIDCVLRVVSYTYSATEIIGWVNQAGFQCQELE